jgi:hypothetical protein
MGSGREAAVTSGISGAFLHQTLAAGASKGVAMRALNTVLAERGCECFASTQKGCDHDPNFSDRFKLIENETLGNYLEGTHVDGDFFFLIGHKGT